MTKKTSREILVDENRKFFGKGKISHRVGNASLPQGAMDAPCTLAHLPDNVSLLVLKPRYHKILRVHGYGRHHRPLRPTVSAGSQTAASQGLPGHC